MFLSPKNLNVHFQFILRCATFYLIWGLCMYATYRSSLDLSYFVLERIISGIFPLDFRNCSNRVIHWMFSFVTMFCELKQTLVFESLNALITKIGASSIKNTILKFNKRYIYHILSNTIVTYKQYTAFSILYDVLKHFKAT